MDWKTMLAYITGSVDEDLLLRNEYLAAENRILRGQVEGRLKLTDGERKTLAEIGKKLGKKVLEEVASIVKPDTILATKSTAAPSRMMSREIVLSGCGILGLDENYEIIVCAV